MSEVALALMLLISFRSIQGMFIPMLTATLSTVWGLGLQGHTGIAIDGWNAAVPILLIAVAAAHSAQMLKRYIEEFVRTGSNEIAVIESTVRIGPVMVAAGATAALGFASLAFGQGGQYTSPGALGIAPENQRERMDTAAQAARWQLGALRLDPWVSLHDIRVNKNEGEDTDVSAGVGAGLRAYVPVGSKFLFAANEACSQIGNRGRSLANCITILHESIGAFRCLFPPDIEIRKSFVVTDGAGEEAVTGLL